MCMCVVYVMHAMHARDACMHIMHVCMCVRVLHVCVPCMHACKHAFMHVCVLRVFTYVMYAGACVFMDGWGACM